MNGHDPEFFIARGPIPVPKHPLDCQRTAVASTSTAAGRTLYGMGAGGWKPNLSCLRVWLAPLLPEEPLDCFYGNNAFFQGANSSLACGADGYRFTYACKDEVSKARKRTASRLKLS